MKQKIHPVDVVSDLALFLGAFPGVLPPLHSHVQWVLLEGWLANFGMSPSLTSDWFLGWKVSLAMDLSVSVRDLDWREPLASDLAVSVRDLAVEALSVEVKLADFSCAGILVPGKSRSCF